VIYLLKNPGSVGEATTDFLPCEPHNVGSAPKCPECNRYVGMLRWQPPFRVELETWGSEYGDIAFGPGDSLLVSYRFASLWLTRALVGLEGFEEVEVVDVRRHKKMEERRPRYFRVLVVRSDVAVDQLMSGVEWEIPPSCSVCRIGGNLKGWSQIVLEAPPVENVFIARGLPGQVIVDDRFRSFLEEYQIANARLVPGPDAGYRF
jgi:hypothetical protein